MEHASKLSICAIKVAPPVSPATILANDHEQPFEEGRIFFEPNDADCDFGIHI